MGITSRDTALDLYRALAMIYIVAVIHCIYWLGAANILASLLLVEMPVIFFIAGASFNLSNSSKKRSYGAFMLSRVKRVVFPYYIYVAVCVPLWALFCVFVRGVPYGITIPGVARILVSNCNFALPMAMHTWFILPYLLISMLAPVLVRWFGGRRSLLYIAAALLAVLVIDMAQIDFSGHKTAAFLWDLTREVLGYSIFFVCGFLYRRVPRRWLATAGTLLAAGTVLLVMLTDYNMDMQTNKFPPNLIFVLYGLSFICLSGFLLSYITLRGNRVTDRFNKAGYTIYLYQNMVIYLIAAVVAPIPQMWIWLPLAIMLSLVCNYLLSFPTYALEKRVMGLMHKARTMPALIR